MSERDDGTFRALVVIYLLLLTVAMIMLSKADVSELRDLQRRVGQLEERCQ